MSDTFPERDKFWQEPPAGHPFGGSPEGGGRFRLQPIRNLMTMWTTPDVWRGERRVVRDRRPSC